MLNATILMLALAGCKGGDDDGPTETAEPDTEAPTDDTADTGEVECLTVPSEITPDDGDSDVYYRDEIRVAFSQEATDATFVLTRGDTGEAHPLDIEWNGSNEIATLSPNPVLAGGVSYALDITVCDQSYLASFGTSQYGQELEIEQSLLLDRTYAMEFSQVDFTEPEGIGSLLSLYLDIPILIGVGEVRETELDLIGAQGRVDSEGEYQQRKKSDGVYVPTWDFSGVDFSEAPYFRADTELITLVYGGVDIPVSDFHLEATFAPDAGSFGGGQLWGLGDTRYLGQLIAGSDDPNYVCDLVASVGASCEACPTDSEPYCVFLKGESIEGVYVEDLVIEAIDDDGPVDG